MFGQGLTHGLKVEPPPPLGIIVDHIFFNPTMYQVTFRWSADGLVVGFTGELSQGQGKVISRSQQVQIS